MASHVLADRCVTGITANEQLLRAQVENSIGTVTVLNPRIGYTAATAIAQEALSTGRSITQLVLEKELLEPTELVALLRPEALATPPDATPAADAQMH